MYFSTPYKVQHRCGAVIKGMSHYSLSCSDHTVRFVRKNIDNLTCLLLLEFWICLLSGNVTLKRFVRYMAWVEGILNTTTWISLNYSINLI